MNDVAKNGVQHHAPVLFEITNKVEELTDTF